MNKMKSFILYGIVMIFIAFSSLVLKGRNDVAFLLLVGSATITFLFSLARTKYRFDKIFSFFLPLALTITRTIWVAHPYTEIMGILSVSAGLFFCATDLVILYFLWRIPSFNKTRTIMRYNIYAYIAFICVSAIFAFNQEFALAGVLLSLKCVVLYLWFSSYPYIDLIKKYTVLGAECALLFQGIVALLQKITGGSIGLAFLGENEDALRYRIIAGEIDRGAAGTFEHSSRLAIFAVFVLLLVIFNEENKKKKYIVVALGFVVLYLAGSRTAMLIFILSLFYYVWSNKSKSIKKKTFVLAFSCTIISLIGLAYGFSANFFDFITDSDLVFQFNNRINHWVVALFFIFQKPFIGYGINNYAAKMTTINQTNFYFLNPVHNSFLLNWFEVGFFGLIAYIALFLFSIFKVKNFKKLLGLQKTALLFIICVVIYNFTGWAFAAPTCIYFLWISFGLIDRSVN